MTLYEETKDFSKESLNLEKAILKSLDDNIPGKTTHVGRGVYPPLSCGSQPPPPAEPPPPPSPRCSTWGSYGIIIIIGVLCALNTESQSTAVAKAMS